MGDTLLTVVVSGATSVVVTAAIHVIRTIGNPLRYRRQPAPLDLSQYRVRE